MSKVIAKIFDDKGNHLFGFELDDSQVPNVLKPGTVLENRVVFRPDESQKPIGESDARYVITQVTRPLEGLPHKYFDVRVVPG